MGKGVWEEGRITSTSEHREQLDGSSARKVGSRASVNCHLANNKKIRSCPELKALYGEFVSFLRSPPPQLVFWRCQV